MDAWTHGGRLDGASTSWRRCWTAALSSSEAAFWEAESLGPSDDDVQESLLLSPNDDVSQEPTLLNPKDDDA
jgi:hypothetical protein